MYEDFGIDISNSTELITLDIDGDGDYESTAIPYDADGDGVEGGYLIESDTNNDGIVDGTTIAYEIDSNGDGIIDSWRYDNYENYWEGQANPNSIEIVGLPEAEDPILASSQDRFLLEDDFIPEDSLLPENDFLPEDSLFPEDEFLPEVELVGNPDSDIENWHQQTYPDTCAIVSQEFILDELTGMDFSEEQLRQEAIDKGYYSPGYGTSLDNLGRLLEDYGFEVERTQDNTLEDLSAKLENGDKVLVSLDADEIWNLGQDDYQEDYLDDYSESSGCIPGQDCNHAVQVIGIDYSDRNNPMVILNDPGSPNGQGTMIPADEFIDAWADSNSYMVSTTGRTIQTV